MTLTQVDAARDHRTPPPPPTWTGRSTGGACAGPVAFWALRRQRRRCRRHLARLAGRRLPRRGRQHAGWSRCSPCASSAAPSSTPSPAPCGPASSTAPRAGCAPTCSTRPCTSRCRADRAGRRRGARPGRRRHPRGRRRCCARAPGRRSARSLASGPLWVVAGTTWWPAFFLFPLAGVAAVAVVRPLLPEVSARKVEEEMAWTDHAAAMEEGVAGRDDLRASLGQAHLLRRCTELAATVHDRFAVVLRPREPDRAPHRHAAARRARRAPALARGRAGHRRPARHRRPGDAVPGHHDLRRPGRPAGPAPARPAGRPRRRAAAARPAGRRARARAAAPALPAGSLDVQFRDLHFAYAEGRFALEHVDLTVPAGHTCALVGRTGSGKSTLASLLSRAVEPERGTVLRRRRRRARRRPAAAARRRRRGHPAHRDPRRHAGGEHHAVPDPAPRRPRARGRRARPRRLGRRAARGASTPRSARAAPASRRARSSWSPSPGCWCATSRSWCSTRRPRGWTR